ncbi:hypothetical protein AcV7_005077 [Taiwanofungus camphoratus]|nr:hypothetical protein AcV7_005077 [Antrodia cinnamomea]
MKPVRATVYTVFRWPLGAADRPKPHKALSIVGCDMTFYVTSLSRDLFATRVHARASSRYVTEAQRLIRTLLFANRSIPPSAKTVHFAQSPSWSTIMSATSPARPIHSELCTRGLQQ